VGINDTVTPNVQYDDQTGACSLTPVVTTTAATTATSRCEDKGPRKTVSDQPLIQGLFESLPDPGPWAEADRQEWLNAAKAIFTLVYKAAPKALPSGSEQPSEQSRSDASGSEPQP
jgi:hypothetical protein